MTRDEWMRDTAKLLARQITQSLLFDPLQTRGNMKARNLILKTVGPNGESHGGFVWPLEVGALVRPEKWDPTRICGDGLHGLLHGRGDGKLLDWSSGAKWLVVEGLESIIQLGEKVKCKSAIVRHVGDRKSATDFIRKHTAASFIVGITITGGDLATLTGGYRATLTGGNASTLTGGDLATLTGGDRATLTGGDRATLTGGNASTLTGGTSTRFRGGQGAVFITRLENSVAVVGRDSIEPHVWYKNVDGRYIKSV